MAKKYKILKISEQGFFTNEAGEPVFCPVRDGNCNLKCMWLSVEDRIVYCRDMAIGALKGKPLRSFHLYSGPEVYDIDESLKSNML
jgi:hypothetical protein